MSSTGLGPGMQPPDPQNAYRVKVAVALAGLKRSAGWFNAIALFSIVNSVITLFNGKWYFLLGLGITKVIDESALQSGNSKGQMLSFVVTLVVAGFFWLMGHFTKQGQLWSLVLGMTLYALDGGLLLLFQVWLSVAFHGYALFMLGRAFSAIKQLEAAKQDAAAHGVFLDAPGS